jgi:hypothetical protein
LIRVLLATLRLPFSHADVESQLHLLCTYQNNQTHRDACHYLLLIGWLLLHRCLARSSLCHRRLANLHIKQGYMRTVMPQTLTDTPEGPQNAECHVQMRVALREELLSVGQW